jgi:arylsulfatase A-like enzyme
MTRAKKNRAVVRRIHTTTTRVGAVCLLMLLAVACNGPAPVEIPSAPHPIIVIDIDSLRADHLGCYGYERPTSPNIDALAAESVRFEWAFAQAPNTAPSQASIMSSLYPTTHGMTGETRRLPDTVTTLAEALSEHGYITAAFVDGGYLSEGFGLSQGFDEYDNSRGAGIAEIGPKALEWLRDNATESFFLLVHTYDPHIPFAPPQAYRELLAKDLVPATEGFEPVLEHMEAARAALQGDPPQPLAEGDLAYTTALYDAEIRYVDSWIGELMAEVRKLGLDTTATIVLISDHGEELQEHGDLLHEQLYTPVTRIPLLLRLPQGHKAGVISKLVQSIDLMPTLLELAGAPVPPQAQGTSLLPKIRGESKPPYLAFGESTFFGRQRYVALDGYRLIFTSEGETSELYRFTEDPLELTDLAASEPEVVQALRQRIETWQDMVVAAAVDATLESDVDPETLEQLKGLGYIQ